MNAGSFDLRAMLEFRPNEGRIRFGTDRMLMFRQAAFGVLRALLFEQLGTELTQCVLAQFGYRCGGEDHRTLATLFEWDTETDTLAAGPVLHSFEGIVLAKPEHIEYDRAAGTLHMFGTWENSYEAEIHLGHVGQSNTPVCHSLSGYASGYASAFMDNPMICVEHQCVAAGADMCRWEIRPADEWDERALPYKRALDSTAQSIQKELERSLALSTPLLRVWDGIIAVPLIGSLDISRTEMIMNRLLGEIVRTSARAIILDVTGVESVDEATANGVLRLDAAVKLLGAECHLSGVRGDVARKLASTDIDATKLPTFATLKQALQHCLSEHVHR